MIDIRTGIDANDYSNLAKQEHLDELEVELKKLGTFPLPPPSLVSHPPPPRSHSLDYTPSVLACLPG
jgi:hypothetical protein